MKAIDLIIKLQQLDPDKQVMIDVSPNGSEMFHLLPVSNIDEVECSGGENVIMLFADYENKEQNQN